MRVLKKEVTWYTWSLLLLWLAFDGLEALRPTRTLTSRSVRLAAAAVAVVAEALPVLATPALRHW
jgi:hypothetical protein